MICKLNINDPSSYLREYGIVDSKAMLLATKLPSDSNLVFRIRGAKTSWVMKIAEQSTEAALLPFRDNPDAVINFYRLAYEWGLSPKVVQADLDENLIILEDGGTPYKEIDKRYWHDLIQCVNKLHSNECFSLTNKKDRALLLAEVVLKFERRGAMRDSILSIIEKYKSRGYHQMEHVPGHGDIFFNNIIQNKKGEMQFIDWDFAGNMPIYWDLAAILINHGIPVEHYKEALEGYNIKNIDWSDLNFNCAFYSLIASCWYETTLVREFSHSRAKRLFNYHQQIHSEISTKVKVN